jgi:hypothetical protein
MGLFLGFPRPRPGRPDQARGWTAGRRVEPEPESVGSETACKRVEVLDGTSRMRAAR